MSGYYAWLARAPSVRDLEDALLLERCGPSMQRCIEAGIQPSTGSVGNAYDNALAESFFSTLESELLARVTLRSCSEADREPFDHIEGWYDPRRRHSALGYESPQRFEEAALEAVVAPGP